MKPAWPLSTAHEQEQVGLSHMLAKTLAFLEALSARFCKTEMQSLFLAMPGRAASWRALHRR